MNLVTSCEDCNAGKSDKLLSSMEVLEKQRKELESLEKRREQIEFLFKWKKSLHHVKDDEVSKLVQYIEEISRFGMSKRNQIRKRRRYIVRHLFNKKRIVDAVMRRLIEEKPMLRFLLSLPKLRNIHIHE